MKNQPSTRVVSQDLIYFCLAALLLACAAPSADGQGAIQSVRRRVSGIELAPTQSPGEAPPSHEAPPGRETPPGTQPPSPASLGAAVGKLDTTYVAPNASILVVLRPAQIIASPVAQLLPVEIASAAGKQHLGIDPAEVDEVVAFLDLSNPLAQQYGATFKFKQPFRAVNIPQQARVGTKLSEFNGKKYLQNASPMAPSFYGPNNKTLVMAPDAVLRQVVTSSAQPKSGPLLDRAREAPAGSDLYVAVNVASLKGLIQMYSGSISAKMSPEDKLLLDATAAIEVTANLTARGPTSVVLHCNDEAAAQQLEPILTAKLQSSGGSPTREQPQPQPPGPFDDAFAQYRQRLYQKYPLQRNGASITLFRIEAEDPLQPHLLGMAVGAVAGAVKAATAIPQIQAAQKAFAQQGGPPGAGPQPGAEASAAPGPEASTPPGPESTPPPGAEGSPPAPPTGRQ